MHVRLTTNRVGPQGLQYEGEVYDLPESEALSLIHAGQAEPTGSARQASPPEAAVVAPPRTAAEPAPRSRTVRTRHA